MEPPASQPLISPQDVGRLEAIGVAAVIGAVVGMVFTPLALSSSQWSEPDNYKYFGMGAVIGASAFGFVVFLIFAFVELAPGPNDYD